SAPEYKLQVEGTSAHSLPAVALPLALGTVDQQDLVRKVLFFENTTQVPISNIVLSAGAKWRAIFRGTWANNAEGGSLWQPGAYVELTSESPVLAVGQIYLTLSRSATTGKLQAITSSGSASKAIAFSGTIEILSSNLNSGWANSMIIQGNVGIGTLAGSGNRPVYSDPSGILTNSSSDRSLKKNISTISSEIDPLTSLQKLRGVFFNWDTSTPRAANFGDQREMGLIAQEVEPVLPQVVGTNSDGTKSVDYPKLTAFLIEVAKQQQAQLEAQKAVNKELAGRLNALENK
ncbi:MAG: tail fiber domain-containing protein, partial [Candidatus Margulisiibacteriota bacterium]